MKKSRIFMGASALLLAITAMLATKANKKFVNTVATVYYNVTGSQFATAFKIVSGSNFAFFTGSISGRGEATTKGLVTKTLYYWDAGSSTYTPAFNGLF